MNYAYQSSKHGRRNCLHRRVDLLEKHQQQQNAEDGENQECKCKPNVQPYLVQAVSVTLEGVRVLG